MVLQALQQLWESARFTYQIQNPASQASQAAQPGPHRMKAASRLKAAAAESAAEAESSGGEEEEEEGDASQQQPLQGSMSQMVGRRAWQGSAMRSTDSRWDR